jgi:NADP-dependent 3-hydroxy acid dehydrogenase YdfG
MAIDLHGNVAVVTGASSGIGEAISIRLAALGASVVLVGRRPEALSIVAKHIDAAGGHAISLAADVSDLSSIRAAVGRVITTCERIDIVVNNAGTAALAPFASAEAGEWQKMVDVNISGVINTTHAALPYLLNAAETSARGVADVITIGSAMGRRVGAIGGVYAATKHAVGAFSESLRQELAGRAVRVGLVEPGFVDTPLTTNVPAREQFTFLRPEDVAEAVEYMISRPAQVAVNEVLLRSTGQAA